jgi:hypothetical protein
VRVGDLIEVLFSGDWKPDRGILVDHTDDFSNVTIRTDRGGLMNGMVENIREANEKAVAISA